MAFVAGTGLPYETPCLAVGANLAARRIARRSRLPAWDIIDSIENVASERLACGARWLDPSPPARRLFGRAALQ